MTNYDRVISNSLEDVAKTLKRMANILETLNTNLVLIGRDLAPVREFGYGDFVKVVDPDSIAKDEVGRVVRNAQTIEVKFASRSGGEFLRASLAPATPEEYQASQEHWQKVWTENALKPAQDSAPEGENLKKTFEIDQYVRVSEPRHLFYQHEGKIVTVLPDVVRVMFPGIEGYSVFTREEIEHVDRPTETPE